MEFVQLGLSQWSDATSRCDSWMNVKIWNIKKQGQWPNTLLGGGSEPTMPTRKKGNWTKNMVEKWGEFGVVDAGMYPGYTFTTLVKILTIFRVINILLL